MKTDPCLASEQISTILQGAVGYVKTVLEPEDGAQPSAEILTAAQTPSRRKHVSALQRKRAAARRSRTRRGDACVVLIHNACIDEAKKRHAALRMCSAGHKHGGPRGKVSHLQQHYISFHWYFPG